MTERLTTLAAVKDWLDIETDTSDTGLVRLINSASQFILNYLNRDSFQRRTYTQNFKGNGKDTMLLRNWPILSVASVGTMGRLITASTLGVGGLPSSGYTISDPRTAPQSINLYGYGFVLGAPSQIVYDAGFEATDTSTLVAATVPTDPIVYTPGATGPGQWTEDLGVTLDGVVAVKVDSSPDSGEYSVDEWGIYTFNDTDADSIAVISYSYVPWVVSQAAIELIGGVYRRADRIGVLSKTLGGQETITYSNTDFTQDIRNNLQIYMNVVPM